MLALVLSAASAAPFQPVREDLPTQGLPVADIINGVDAANEDWPMTGGLIVSGRATVAGFEPMDGRGFFCSSTLIAPDVVLTAAHCVDVNGLLEAASAQGVTVESYENLEFGWSREKWLYEWSLEDSVINGVKDWPADTQFATKWIPHPEFDLFALQTGLANNHDIGLIFLEAPVFDVPFALLPTADEGGQLAVGNAVEIVGWGQQDQDPLPGTVGIKQMGTSVISELAAPEFQVGAAYTDVRKCHGDSGGPTFMEVETTSSETWRLIGVTSHAYDTTDCNVTGGVDTRVDHLLDWIDATMREGCADGTRVWCETPGVIAPPDENGVYAWELSGDTDAGDDEDGGGCGCDSRGPSSAPLLGVLSAVAWVRRRRSTR